MSRNFIFYILVIAIFGSLLWLVFNQGSKLEVLQSPQTSTGNTHAAISSENSEVKTPPHVNVVVFLQSLFENLEHPLSLLLIQIVVIVFSSKLLASLMSQIGQPMVVGEVIAGILLGPSVLGYFLPGLSQFIFQPASLPNLDLELTFLHQPIHEHYL